MVRLFWLIKTKIQVLKKVAFMIKKNLCEQKIGSHWESNLPFLSFSWAILPLSLCFSQHHCFSVCICSTQNLNCSYCSWLQFELFFLLCRHAFLSSPTANNCILSEGNSDWPSLSFPAGPHNKCWPINVMLPKDQVPSLAHFTVPWVDWGHIIKKHSCQVMRRGPDGNRTHNGVSYRMKSLSLGSTNHL